jgi:transcriptional regulator with XRE-family HTH domain
VLEVKRLRQERGWTQTELAYRAGLAPSVISQIENGKRDPTARTLRKLAEAFVVEVGDLFPKGQARLPLENSGFMDRPDVEEWLRRQGHITTGAFLSRTEELELEIDEDEFPHAIEEAIEELHRDRDHLLEAVGAPNARRTLFPPISPEGLTGDERLRAVFKPTRQVTELKTEIRREYAARELALVNYSKDLFVLGKAAGYLGYEAPTEEHARKRHQRMLEARRALEESYARAAAV